MQNGKSLFCMRISHAKRLVYNGMAQALHDARNLDFKTGSKNRLGLGYHFLKNYISVWDYSRRTLTLLRP